MKASGSMRILIVLFLISVLVAACTPPAQEPAATEPTTQAPAATEAPAQEPAASETDTQATGEKKILRLGLTNPPKNLNTFLSDYVYDMEAVFNTHCRLAQFDEDLNTVPYLTTWEISDDGTVYTFHINEDAKWHDGTPVTSKDVVLTLKVTAHPDSGSVFFDKIRSIKGAQEYRDGTATEIEGVQVVDDKTFTITLDEPNATFLPVLHSSNAVVIPDHILGSVPMDEMADHSYWRNPVGCGPYKWIEYVPDQYIHLEKDPDFFLGEPKIDEIYISLGTSAGLQAAFETGQIDAMKVDQTEVERFESLPFATTFRAESFVNNLVVNTRNPFLSDVTFRKALMYAMDRQAMVDAGFLGYGEVASNCFVTPWTLSPDITTYPYDPEKAKELLEEAGWDGSVVFRVLLGTGRPDRERMTLMLQQNLQDVGIETNIETMEGGTVIENMGKGEFDMGIIGYGTMSVMPDTGATYLTVEAIPPAGSNYSFYEDPKMTELFDAAARESDEEARQKIFWEITERTTDLLPLLPLGVQHDVYAVNTDHVSMPSETIISRNRPGGELTPLTWDIINWDLNQ